MGLISRLLQKKKESLLPDILRDTEGKKLNIPSKEDVFDLEGKPIFIDTEDITGELERYLEARIIPKKCLSVDGFELFYKVPKSSVALCSPEDKKNNVHSFASISNIVTFDMLNEESDFNNESFLCRSSLIYQTSAGNYCLRDLNGSGGGLLFYHNSGREYGERNDIWNQRVFDFK